MNVRSSPVILTLNLGSSSVKLAVFRPSGDEEGSFDRLLSGKLNRIGLESSSFVAKDAGGATLVEKHTELKSYRNALETLLAWIESDAGGIKPEVTGHHVVHGGARYIDPQLVTPSLLYDLKNLVPLAPDHLPQEIDAIESVQRLRPDLSRRSASIRLFIAQCLVWRGSMACRWRWPKKESSVMASMVFLTNPS